jgi:SnoaL-like protein
MSSVEDRLDLIALGQAWGIARDQGLWEHLAETFHPDGTISVTWFSGPFTQFIEASKRMHQPRSPRTKHLIGTPHLRINGRRALSEASVQIIGRFAVNGVAADNICYARFFDKVEKRDGRWRVLERVAIYEKDRLDPVVPSEAFDKFMAETDFSSVPEPYRFLGQRLLALGLKLADSVLCDGSPETLAVLRKGADWLAQA